MKQIIEALEDYVCGLKNDIPEYATLSKIAQLKGHAIEMEKVLARAKELAEPCVYRKIITLHKDNIPGFITGCGFNELITPKYCPDCGRKVKYED